MKSLMALTVLTLLASKPSHTVCHGYNPNPPGVLKDDSATDVVLRYLRTQIPRFVTREQIVVATGCKPKSIDWALYYLRGLKIIECRRGTAKRSPLYQEYRSNQPINELV